jgi:hypothetical protein
VNTAAAITLCCAVTVALGVIGAGLWRIAQAVFALAAEVKLLAYRMNQVEQAIGNGHRDIAPRIVP